MALKTITYTYDDKLPEWATPEALVALYTAGENRKTLRQLAQMTGVSREKIRQLIKKAQADRRDGQ